MLNNGLKLAVYGISDVGLSRDHNEDCISWDIDMGLIMLADGMGGHNAGEVASEMAVTAIRDALLDVLTPEMREANAIKCEDAVRESVVYANEEIHGQAHKNVEYAGMGTTAVVALFRDENITYAHVGDSRLYRIRGGELQQVTQDHSLVQEMVDNGYLSEEEALISTSRNLITRALGIAPEVEVDVSTETLESDDIYLLCSDGLSDMVSDEDILAIVTEHSPNYEKVAQSLVNQANNNGGTDNISVVLVTMNEAFSDEHGLSSGVSQEIEPQK